MLGCFTSITLRMKRVSLGPARRRAGPGALPRRDVRRRRGAHGPTPTTSSAGWTPSRAAASSGAASSIRRTTCTTARTARARADAPRGEPGAAADARGRRAEVDHVGARCGRSRTIPACALVNFAKYRMSAARGAAPLPPVARGLRVPARLRARLEDGVRPRWADPVPELHPRGRRARRAIARSSSGRIARGLTPVPRRLQAPPPSIRS